MKTVVVIPSRFGSSRFEGKPLSPICGKPMIQWVYERCKACASVDETVVATDEQLIYDSVTNFGGRALMTAPENRSGTDRVAEAASLLELSDDAVVVNVQGDQPLIDPRSIQAVIDPLTADPSLGMTTLVYKIIDEREKTDPKDVKVVFDADFNALYFSRSPLPFARDLPAGTVDMFKHLGIYAYRHLFLKLFSGLPTGRLEDIEKLEQLRALEYGYPIRVIVTPFDSPEVDLPEDIARIEGRIRRETK